MLRRAQIHDVEKIAALFFQYHQFYQVPSSLAQCQDYLAARLAANESIIFIAEQDNQVLGFTQLYPLFSSLSMQRIFVIYDLFVVESARRLGLAEKLMQAVEAFARSENASALMLETAHTNTKAQALYEKLGYQRENEFYTYYKPLA
jgi:ribosomal protein S18 acetylase RimI-like enzyme